MSNKKTANLTIWFDWFSNKNAHFEYLKNILTIPDTENIGIQGIFYSKEIGQLILKNKENINNLSFENLEIGKEVIINNMKYKIKHLPKINPMYIWLEENEKGIKIVNIGEFELIENITKKVKSF